MNTINIELGKKYVLNDGRIVRIICTDGADPCAPIIGLVQPNEGLVMWFARNGLQYSNNDTWITAEYREPRIAYFVEKDGAVWLRDNEKEAREVVALTGGRMGVLREVVE